jgi:three-Cys-motif partner protein
MAEHSAAGDIIMSIRTTIWDMEPHTEAKHVILRRYLQAWYPIMSTWNTHIIFIDGFAGPGRYSKGEEGSPIIALKTLLDHSHFPKAKPGLSASFIFIEKDPARKLALEKEIIALEAASAFPPWIDYDVREAEFADEIPRVCSGYSVLPPTFVFIDPFGFSGIPLETISLITINPKCECLITFMFPYIYRFMDNPEYHTRLDALFGTRAWRNALEIREPTAKRFFLLDLYRQQLSSKAGLSFIRTFEMIDFNNQSEYFLYFGTNNELGLSKMKEVMWNADPIEGCQFSDRIDSQQSVIFEKNPNTSPLRQMLIREFKGKGWVSIGDIERYVLLKTPYCENKHLKRATLKPLEASPERIINVNRPVGKPKGTYPEGTEIRFA